MPQINLLNINYHELTQQVKTLAVEEGFIAANIGKVTLPRADLVAFNEWLSKGYSGQIGYLQRHAVLRANPKILLPEATSVISLKMPYCIKKHTLAKENKSDSIACVSSYALGRDYHKVLRMRLHNLARRIEDKIGKFTWRACCDSAPLSEIALAIQSGSGWRAKNTLLLSRKHGSLFFLGELLTNLPLIFDSKKEEDHCGRCTRCLDACPTRAIITPYTLDARRCISYLTIELKQAVPLEFRHLIGNRIYGCDDCQTCCPWNRFAVTSCCPDFFVRNSLDNISLLELFSWSEIRFKERFAGSPIYRIGHSKWLSNIAIALGNATYSAEIMYGLSTRLNHEDELVSEPVHWAIDMQKMRYDAR